MVLHAFRNVACWLAIWSMCAVVAQAEEQPATPDGATSETTEAVDFAKDIQPIFAAHCYECHGADMQEGGLRLHRRDDALTGGDGGRVIEPGNSKASRLIRYVTGVDEDLVMPPYGDRLSDEQVALLRSWIDAGAAWPEDADAEGPAGSDHWAYRPPQRPDLPPVHDTSWPRNAIDHFVLARLEAEGLQPSPEADRATLLRRASLDLIGLPPTLEEIEAFLTDERPDAYEQAVERLLASPRYGERWARLWLDLARYADTQGYEKDNRRTIWPYRDWVIDALNRDLPFDQFTIEQIAGDMLPDATLAQRVATGFHRNTMTNTEGGTDDEEFRVAAVVDRVNTTFEVWMGTTMACAQCHSHKYDPFTQREYYQVFAIFNNTADHDANDDRPFVEVPTPEQLAERQRLNAAIAELEKQIEEIEPEDRTRQAAWEQRLAAALTTDDQSDEPSDEIEALPQNVREALSIAADERNEEQAKLLAEHYRTLDPPLVELQQQIEAQRKAMPSIPTTLVMEELPEPRETRIHLRGSFLDPGELVEPGVPAVLHPLPEGQPANRLTFARWLVDPANPLVGRVTMNRHWEQFFGQGLVATSEDFGRQGEPPSHPELLDWLATELVAQNWSIKAMHRLIVTSATYRQSSRVTPELIERDPNNRLLARGPRVRLEAEAIRDQALAIAGLLSRKMHGPSVMPPQPEGIWQVVYSGDQWVTSEGEDRYRRGVYTFWRRTSPYPSMVVFDAPSREFCVVRRSRTNTPLQALTTLNDPVYFEAAQALARRIVTEASGDETQRAEHGFRLCLAREPSDDERARLVALATEERAHFAADPESAAALVGEGELPEGVDSAELAAWTVVANVLLNLDELITKD